MWTNRNKLLAGPVADGWEDFRALPEVIGRRVHAFGGGGKAPKPDRQIKSIASNVNELGKQWLEITKGAYEDLEGRQGALDAATGTLVNQQLGAAQTSIDRSNSLWDRYQSVFQPVENQLVADAVGYDSAAALEKAAAGAQADVYQQRANADEANRVRMAGLGIDPRSGSFASINRGADIDTALGAVSASNAAKDSRRKTGIALRQGVASLGQSTQNQALQQLGFGLDAGTGAVSSLANADANYRANLGVLGSGYSSAASMQTGAAGVLSNYDQARLQAANIDSQNRSANMQAIGSLAGAGAGLGIMA